MTASELKRLNDRIAHTPDTAGSWLCTASEVAFRLDVLTDEIVDMMDDLGCAAMLGVVEHPVTGARYLPEGSFGSQSDMDFATFKLYLDTIARGLEEKYGVKIDVDAWLAGIVEERLLSGRTALSRIDLLHRFRKQHTPWR